MRERERERERDQVVLIHNDDTMYKVVQTWCRIGRIMLV